MREQHPPDTRFPAVHASALGLVPLEWNVADRDLGFLLDGFFAVAFATPVAMGKGTITLENENTRKVRQSIIVVSVMAVPTTENVEVKLFI